MQINRINFSMLKKLEVQFLASSVIEIVEKYDPETLNIKEIFDILVEQTPQIKLLKIRYGQHPITLELVKLRKRRNAYAQGIIDKVRTIERAKEVSMEGPLKIAKPVALHYLQYLPKKGEKGIRQILIQLFELVESNEDLSEAMGSLDLFTYFDNLQSVHMAIDKQYDARREDISARPKMNTTKIVAALKVALHDLFKEIEVAQKKYRELDYTLLIDELNNEIAKANAEAKARASYNKKKAEDALGDDEIVEDDGIVIQSRSERPSEFTQSTERMHPLNVEVDNEENSEQLDIKKTVAVSTKQTRLPIVSTEA